MLKKIGNLLLVNNSVRQTFIKNTFWLFVGETVSRLFKFILILYATRILGVAGWGTLSYVFSVVGLFLILSDLGLNVLVTREVAKQSEQKFQYLSTAFFIRLTLLIVSVCLVLITVPYISNIPESKNVLFVVAILFAFDSIRELLVALLRALEQMEKEAFIKIINGLSTGILGLTILFLTPSVENLAYAYLTGSIIGLVVTIYTLRKYLKNILENFTRNLIQPILQTTWPLFIFGVIGVIMTNTDIVMLGWWKTPTDIGLYSAAQRLIQFLLIIPNLIAIAMFPIFSKLFSTDTTQLRTALEKTLTLIFLLSLPTVTGGILLGQEIILVVFGASYVNSTLVFQIFLGMILTMFPMLIINNYIFVQNQQQKFIWLMTGGVLLNIALNFILIQKFGIYGAALATVLSNFILAIFMWHKAKKISYFEIFPHIKKIMLATIVMGIIIFWLKYFGLNIFLNIVLSGLTFFYILFITKEPILQEAKRLF